MVSVKVSPLIIGLTGGIGTGKSTVTEYLKHKGYEVIDADLISHQITEKGSPVLAQVADAFGKEVLFEDGSLNRKLVAQIVFSDASNKAKLESIITSEVIRIVGERVKEKKCSGEGSLVFVDAPLLFESGCDKLTEYNWTVICDRSVQIERAMKRDNASVEEIEARINNQMSAEEKIRLSDDIIDNSKGLEELYEQIEGLVRKYEEK